MRNNRAAALAWLLAGAAIVLLLGAGAGASTEIAGRFWATAPTVAPNNQKVLYIDSRSRLVTASDAAMITSAVTARTTDIQGFGAATGRRLGGFAVRESAATAAPATVILRHGTADTDTMLVPIELAAGESAREWYGPGGIEVPNGVFIEVAAGEVDVVLFRPPDRDDQ